MKISPLVVGTAFLGSVSAGPPELPLDGSTKSGTLSQNQYDYYTISSEDSGDVTITTTVTANPIGVWTWIGRDYQPVDGNSDWNQGAIINYPAKQTVENLEPNETYYVGVQGIGSPTASYTISATIDNKPYTPPTSIKVDDDLPITGQASPMLLYCCIHDVVVFKITDTSKCVRWCCGRFRISSSTYSSLRTFPKTVIIPSA
eukprot:INCI15868.1.p1 GENE.INCI15868.1~~INCI15868.1.p1  ORF type:complete len:202 (-),score=15.53 INCI15868.1:429-1034(-)